MNAVNTLEYRGSEISIFYDPDAPNPWTDWDSEPPMIVAGDRFEHGYGLTLDPPGLTKAEIKANLKAVKGLLGYDRLLNATSDLVRYYRRTYGTATELVNDALVEALIGMDLTERLDSLAEIYSWKGIKALSTTVTGNVPRDWARLLIAATPEWIEEVGAPADSIDEALKGAAKLYSAWAFGDVYGFVAETPDGEDIESVWGYYGDPEESGLMEAAKAAIDYYLEAEKKRKAAKVKAWVKNKVPLIYRTFG